jgi:hypothetical protein
MAKVIAPFMIKGTLDDMNFYMASNENLVRQKGNSGITKEQFAKNPIFNRIRLKNFMKKPKKYPLPEESTNYYWKSYKKTPRI